jgi:hypothetical protein
MIDSHGLADSGGFSFNVGGKLRNMGHVLASGVSYALSRRLHICNKFDATRHCLDYYRTPPGQLSYMYYLDS